MDQDFYSSLGRLVICPRCGMHSDLEIDRASMPTDDRDSIPYTLQGKTSKGCVLFHEDPFVAWLWFKYHDKSQSIQPVVSVENLYPVPEFIPASSDDYMTGV